MSALLASERGDTLVEVLVGALLIALIAIATFNGLDASSRSTADERTRAEADVLAQEAEDRLRGEPISVLEAMQSTPRVEPATVNNTAFTVTSSTEYRPDNETSTSSCNSSAPTVGYYLTSSQVSWKALGVRKPVVETSVISPPPASALIALVTNATATGVPKMNVTAEGPLPLGSLHSLETASNGCAILALTPGYYKIDVSRTGYVDENWDAHSSLDSVPPNTDYLTAESATRVAYHFGEAGILQATFTGSTPLEPALGDTFVAVNTGMSSPQPGGTLGSFKSVVPTEQKVFPFTSGYTVYAGTCAADSPHTVNPTLLEPPPVVVPPGKTGNAKVTVPPIKVIVKSGKSSTSPGLAIEGAQVTLTDVGCNNTARTTLTNSEGGLVRPWAPFGKYVLCVTGGTAGGKNKATTGLAAGKKYTTGQFSNNTAAGPSELANITNGGLIGGSAVIYMESMTGPGTLESGTSC